MRRLSRPPPRPFYLWFHIQKTAPSFILWWPETEILFDPLRHSSPFIGLQRCKPIQMGHSLHIRGSGGGGGGLDTILMSMVIAQHSYCDNYRYFIVQKSVEVLLILKPFFCISCSLFWSSLLDRFQCPHLRTLRLRVRTKFTPHIYYINWGLGLGLTRSLGVLCPHLRTLKIRVTTG
jgi:hypothetical protein